MRILIYKRTHAGDPDAQGTFGVHDCMGIVRNFRFDAVVAVGGIGTEALNTGFAGRVSWVGVGAARSPSHPGFRGPLVTFNKFVDFGAAGPTVHTLAPSLARRLYERRARYLLSGLSITEQREAQALVATLVGRGGRLAPRKIMRNVGPSKICLRKVVSAKLRSKRAC